MPEDLGVFARHRTDLERWGLRLLLDNGWVRRRLAGARSSPVEGRTLDAELAAMLRLDDVDGRSDLRGRTIARARRLVAAGIRAVDAPPPPGVAHEDRRIPGPAGEIPARCYTPDGLEAPSPGVLYIHGGGFVTGSIATHDGLCRRLALGARVRVVSIDYRLAPEHPFPAAVDDCLAAFRWLAAHASELGILPERIAVAGDSAGGNLSAVVSRRTAKEARKPALQVLLYPALDATCSRPSHTTMGDRYFLTRPMCEWYYTHYFAAEGDRSHPDGSPLLAPPEPGVPALIYTSGFDPLRDEGHDYAEALRAAGEKVRYREFPELLHGFMLFTSASRACRLASETVATDVGRELLP